jgi:hypothetical protein
MFLTRVLSYCTHLERVLRLTVESLLSSCNDSRQTRRQDTLVRGINQFEVEHSVLYCTVLYCTVLYCTVLCCTEGVLVRLHSEEFSC